MFRTPSGQTGKTAYTYELASIMNAHRELSARMKRLAEAMAEELPEGATYVDGDVRQALSWCHTAKTFSYETVTDILRTMKS